MSYNIEIIGTGSSGNAILIDDCLLIDCGLAMKKIWPTIEEKVEYLFITHRHGDHLNLAVMKKLYKLAPWRLRNNVFVNQDTLNKILAEKALEELALDYNYDHLIKPEQTYELDCQNGEHYTIETFELMHDVENQGFVITNSKGETLVFATDTNSLEKVPKAKYDYIVVEGNYDEDKLIESMTSAIFEERFRAFRNMRHLSVQQFEDFVKSHSYDHSQIYQLHESGTFGISSPLGLNNQ